MSRDAPYDVTLDALLAATTVLPDEDYEFSPQLAERLAAAGASEIAIDAAGGPGTARRLRQGSVPTATQTA